MKDETDMRGRARFDGVLGAKELAQARAEGARIGYCPQQLGWVYLPPEAPDLAPGVEETTAPLSWHAGMPTAALIKQAPGTRSYPVTRAFSFRPWVEDDLPAYRAALADATLWRFMPEPAPAALSPADLAALIEVSASGEHHMVRAIIHAGGPIGQVRLEYAPGGTTAELSYWLARDARGKGLGRRAVAEFLDHTLPRLKGLRCLSARVHPDNAASARLLSACGFRPSTRAETGLAPRGRDTGHWPVFLRPPAQPRGTSTEASP